MDFFFMYGANGTFQRVVVEQFEEKKKEEDKGPVFPPGAPIYRIKSTEGLIEKREELVGKIEIAVKTFEAMEKIIRKNMKEMEEQSADNKKTFTGLVAEATKQKDSDPEGFKKDMDNINAAREVAKAESLKAYQNIMPHIEKCRDSIRQMEELIAECGNFLEVFGQFCENTVRSLNFKQKGEPVFIDVTSYNKPSMEMEGVPPKGPCDKWQEPLSKINSAKAKRGDMIASLNAMQADYQRLLPIVNAGYDV